jgi:hypothetical protein
VDLCVPMLAVPPESLQELTLPFIPDSLLHPEWDRQETGASLLARGHSSTNIIRFVIVRAATRAAQCVIAVAPGT